MSTLLRENGTALFRLDLLPSIPPYHRRAMMSTVELAEGQLVYYGPMPKFYGVGEVKRIEGAFVAVDFRGTGECGVHEDVLERCYLIPISGNESQIL